MGFVPTIAAPDDDDQPPHRGGLVSIIGIGSTPSVRGQGTAPLF